MKDPHFRKLENLYRSAPVTRWFGSSVQVEEGRAEVRIPVRRDFLHAADAVHGSIYFRALDDAAFFAANSRVPDVFVLTVSFHVHFTRPVREGVLVARGSVVHEAGRLLVAEAQLHDGESRLLGTGSGTFTRSGIELTEEIGYASRPRRQ